MINIALASVNDIPVIRNLAEKIWWPTYSPIIEEVQIRYMLDAIYAESTLTQAMESGLQRFIILYENEIPHGFAAFGKKPDHINIYKLHKLYVLPEDHGKGYGRRLIEEVKLRIAPEKASYLDLNVNRYNPARTFYEKLGFKIIGEEDVPVG